MRIVIGQISHTRASWSTVARLNVRHAIFFTRMINTRTFLCGRVSINTFMTSTFVRTLFCGLKYRSWRKRALVFLSRVRVIGTVLPTLSPERVDVMLYSRVRSRSEPRWIITLLAIPRVFRTTHLANNNSYYSYCTRIQYTSADVKITEDCSWLPGPGDSVVKLTLFDLVTQWAVLRPHNFLANTCWSVWRYLLQGISTRDDTITSSCPTETSIINNNTVRCGRYTVTCSPWVLSWIVFIIWSHHGRI